MSISGLMFRRSLKTGWPRLVLIMLAVAFGVALLFSFTAYYNAMMTTEEPTWTSAVTEQAITPLAEKQIDGVDPALYSIETDVVNLASPEQNNPDAKNVRIYDFALTGENSPELAGLELPAPGEYYISPALANIMAANSEVDLASRYGDTLLGVLPEELVDYRDSLLVVRGVSLAELTDGAATDVEAFLADTANETQVIYTLDPSPIDTAEAATLTVVELIIYLGIFILLFPVLLLISISTRLGSVQREQRYAALRLVGVTNAQVVRIIAFESLVSTLLGIGLGVLVYLMVRPLLLDLNITGSRFWPDAIAVQPWQAVGIVVGTLALALVSNWWGMRHVHTSPLGVSRRQKMEKPPRAWRLLPLLAGCGLVLAAQLISEADLDAATRTSLIIFAVVLIMVGLILATPWLTYRLAGLVSRHTAHPTLLLATRYIRQHARAVARSVSGVVLALFAGSFYLVAVSGVPALEAESLNNDPDSLLRDDTALIKFVEPDEAATVADALTAAGYTYLQIDYTAGAVIGSCSELATYYTGLGCSGDHAYAAVSSVATNPDADPDSRMRFLIYAPTEAELETKLTADVDPATLENPEIRFLVAVPADQIDTLRTLVSTATGGGAAGVSQAYVQSAAMAHTPAINPAMAELAKLAYFGIVITMVVATISIVISTLGSLYERRHTLFTLYLSGMEDRKLRRMVVIESLIPLLLTALLSVALGIWTAVVEITTASDTLEPTLTLSFVAVVIGLLAVATVAIVLVTRKISTLVSPTNNQTE